MCEKCPIDQRYPYYGFPVTPDSRKLRDEAEPDDPIYTDGCMEYSEAIDFIDCPESIIQETAWNLFKEIRTVIHQYAPRFA